MFQLDSHPNERPARIERLAKHPEQRRSLLEELEQPLVSLELVAACTLEQAGGAADVEALPLLEQLGERRPERREERRLPLRQARVLEPLAQLVCAGLQARERVVQILAGPVGEPTIDRLGEG